MDQLHRKLKAQLRLSVTRLRLAQSKKSSLAKQQRRDLAQLLEKGKFESARIRVENVIREDVSIELLEILELLCELLLARFGLLENQRECDNGLEEAVQTIIYSTPKTEVKELQAVRELLMQRFGKEFSLKAIENSDSRVLAKLRTDPPDPDLVEKYLAEIARTYDIPYGDTEKDSSCSDSEKVGVSTATVSSPIVVAPPSPTSENLRPQLHIPKEIAPVFKKKKQSDLDHELQRRFDALKQR